MRRVLRIGAGAGLAVAVLLAVGAGTRFAYTAVPVDAAALRLAWRARVPLVEECRRLTEAEQADLPVHMRREVVCEGRVASYRLEVVVDGVVRKQATVEGAGARGDRPLYVFETLPLEPGLHDIRVEFVRVGGGRGGQAGRAGAQTIPDRLTVRRTVEVGSREVVLVTYDPDGRAFELH